MLIRLTRENQALHSYHYNTTQLAQETSTPWQNTAKKVVFVDKVLKYTNAIQTHVRQ